jgi:thiol-disulfide isomerase/thioredoxin
MNAGGKPASISTWRGKVMLLDFWATECGGCKIEIPWFMEIAEAYKVKRLAVVGVSMDVLYDGLKDSSEGWNKVKPFVRDHKVNYPILMGDDLVTKQYDIQALPATYLIDKRGRVAATYIGIVNKDDVEAHIKTLLLER